MEKELIKARNEAIRALINDNCEGIETCTLAISQVGESIAVGLKGRGQDIAALLAMCMGENEELATFVRIATKAYNRTKRRERMKAVCKNKE